VPYATAEDLELAMGSQVVRAIFDDDLSGTADDSPITYILAEAQSRVDGYLRQLYVIPLDPVPNLVRSITVDVAIALAQKRHPEVVRADGDGLMKRAIEDLQRIRSGEMKLDSMTLPTPRNATITVGSGIAATPAPLPKVFGDDMGDF
jgi:phage gp36-like protein